MLKVTPGELASMERLYPGISRSVRYFEARKRPRRPHCGSADTASVTVGLVGRSIHIAPATSKIKLLPNRPIRGNCFCNVCGRHFTGWVH